MNTRQAWQFGGVLMLLLLGAHTSLLATPYWTPERIAAEYAQSGAATAPRITLPAAPHGASLDEPAYFLHYRMLCDFLVSMQNTVAGPELGGMIEGESDGDENIIQTDNTQEAIRVWSQYAIWTSDTATYAPAIRLAWHYCQNYPAWREEGTGYYQAHNCGWGFEAVRKYRQAYGDTTWNWYADSCAIWTAANQLAFDPLSTSLGQLNPLAQGLAIGGMYPHALYRQRTDWRDFTLTQARRIRLWFESNPARLNANESWALCGGTALWGVCQSLFTAYPDSGTTWLNQYGAQLDVWQSTGQWNHSFCTWYANAQYAAWEISRDDVYWQNGKSIADSLIGLDTDNDGGIYPGRTGFTATNDHSWVSAYMGWMGIERIITNAPLRDAAAMAIVTPDALRPALAGDSLLVRVRVANNGTDSLTMIVHATAVSAPPYADPYADSIAVVLYVGQDSLVTLPHRWAPPDNDQLPPVSALRLSVVASGDFHGGNDTLTQTFDIRRSVTVGGTILSASSGAGLPGHVEFYHEAYPDSLWSVANADADGHFDHGSRRLMTGLNRLRIMPALPFMETERIVTLDDPGTGDTVLAVLPPAAVLLIDDDADSSYQRYYESSLDSLSLPVRRWDVAASGSTPDLTPTPSITPTLPTVIWFTGNSGATSLTTGDITNLTEYLSAGGHLLLTGQNITDLPAAQRSFLTDVLHVAPRTADLNAYQVVGIPDAPVMAGDTLTIIGSGGAYNQTSPASVDVLAGSTAILHYRASPDEICGVIGEHETGRYLFLSFGLEAISGAGNSMRREQFLAHAFAWFGDSLSGVEAPRTAPLADDFVLESVYPNPFNPSTTIRFRAPLGAQNVRLELFNMLGQKVRTLYTGAGTGQVMDVTWDGRADDALPVASGAFLCRLIADDAVQVRTLRLVR